MKGNLNSPQSGDDGLKMTDKLNEKVMVKKFVKQ